jgi:hypothetical protein
MGEFLSQPIKEKQSEDAESNTVKYKFNFNRFVTELVVCKDGEKEWRTPIYLT